MINVLLFLILFAILFPRSLKFLLALIFIGGVMLLGEVHANEAAHKIIPRNWAPCASLNTSRKRMRSLPPDEPEPVSVENDVERLIEDSRYTLELLIKENKKCAIPSH
jgi:hypothetical protein